MRKPALIASFVTVLAAAPSCLGPTEIRVSIRTNAPCTDLARWKGVAVYTGTPGVDVESKAPTLTTATCDSSGNIGSVVVTPAGANNATLGVRVVAGLDKDPEQCRTADYAGCIVTRRTVNFVPHTPLDVVIDLTTDCTGRGCDLNHTCVAGACTDTVSASPPVSADGGVPPRPTVRCGSAVDAPRCPVGDPSNACCLAVDLAANTTVGTCIAASACPSSNLVLYCDDSSDCASVPGDDGGAAVCCVPAAGGSACGLNGAPPAGAQCVAPSRCGDFVAMCEERTPCPIAGNACEIEPALPGYHTCCFNTAP